MKRTPKKLQLAVLAGVAALLLFFSVPASATIWLPVPDPNNSLIFGDFTVFSIPLLNAKAESDITKAKTGPFQIPSNGVKADLATLAAANGQADNSEAGDNVDDAYVQPSGGGVDYFGTGTTADPNPTPFPTALSGADQAGTWDVTVSILRSFLGANDLIWAFDFNETGDTASGLDGEDLLVWASFTLRDLDGPLADVTFFMTADDDDTIGPTPASDSNDVGGAGFDDDWVRVHGTITVDENEDFVHLGPKEVGDPAEWQEVDQNLGTDRAEFAFFSSELDSLVKNSDYDVLSIDVRIARENDGKEQLFIPEGGFRIIPEPSTFIVWSVLAALGVGVSWRRRRKFA